MTDLKMIFFFFFFFCQNDFLKGNLKGSNNTRKAGGKKRKILEILHALEKFSYIVNPSLLASTSLQPIHTRLYREINASMRRISYVGGKRQKAKLHPQSK